jgi:hypothetical protein
VRFTVSVFARAATLVDWLGISTVGGAAQNATWRTVVERMVEVSGGRSAGVEEEKGVARGEEADAIEQWVGGLITRYRRTMHEQRASTPE